MSYARRGGLVVLVVLTTFLFSVPSSASSLRLSKILGSSTGSKKIHALDAGIFFSGSFGYSIGGGLTVLKADNVTNPNGTASGPLRFSLWFTPTPYPSAGFNTGSYSITSSLAAGQSISPVNGGSTGVPFTVPPSGCYNVALVLEENVSGTWTTRDYGNFSLKFDIGGACITSFTASPTIIAPGASSTLAWTTGGGSITSVSIDNGVGSKPANGSAIVSPANTTQYTLTAFATANGTPPSKTLILSVPARWTPIGPDGGVLFGVAVDPTTPTTLFAATVSGAFKSTDSGAHWSKVFGLECPAIAVHPTNSSIVFLADRSRQVYKSTDGGLTFALSSTGIAAVTQPTLYGRFQFQPGNPSTMYFAWPRGLFKSTDGGANWVASDSGAVNNQTVRQLAVDSGNPQVVYLALSGPGVYKSTDAGATWNPAASGLPTFSPTNTPLNAFAQDPSSPLNLFMVSGVDAKLYASLDGGGSWNLRSASALGGITTLSVAPGNGQTLYSGGIDSVGGSPTYAKVIFKSIDGGISWTKVSGSISTFNFASVLATQAGTPVTVYASLGNGLSKTTDGATTWVPINTGLRGEEADYLIGFAPSLPSTWYVSFQQSGIYKTTNGGVALSPVNGNLITAGIGTVAVDPTNPQILLAGGSTTAQGNFDTHYANYLVRSTDGGGTWNPVANPSFPTDSTSLQPWGFVVVPTSPTTYFAMAAVDGVYKSTDAGVTFVRSSNGLPAQSTFTTYSSIAAADNTGTTLYVATSAGMFKTIDGGSNWATPGTGLPPTSYRAVVVSPAAPQRILVASNSGLIYRSTDSGATWNPLSATLPGPSIVLAMDPSVPTTVYAAGTITAGNTRNFWISRSVDGGVNWNPFTTLGLDQIIVFALSVDPGNSNHLFTGSRGGLSQIAVPPPVMFSVSPPSGNTGGGASVTIIGGNFQAGATVTFDGLAATNVVFVNDTTLTASVPAHALGSVTVAVRNPDTQTGSKSSAFTYASWPDAPTAVTATAVAPTQLNPTWHVNLTWNVPSGATSYQVYRRSAASGGTYSLINSPGTNSYSDTGVTAGNSYLYIVLGVNAGPFTSYDSNPDLATTILFTDDPIVAGTTVAKAAHLSEVRDAANAVRALAGLTAYSFTGPASTGTTITAAQINEVRTALDGGMSALSLGTGGYTDTLASGVVIKAVHFQELRTRVK